jgi:hypothetical protein
MAPIWGRPLSRTEQVRHLDNDTLNNQDDNLAVGDAKANAADLSVRQIQSKIAGRASRGTVGEITKRARAAQPAAAL